LPVASHREGTAHVAMPLRDVERGLRGRIAQAVHGVSGNRYSEHARRVTRDAAGLVEAAFAPAAGMQRHRYQQSGQRRGALPRDLGQQHTEHACMRDDAAILELAYQFVDGVFVAQRHDCVIRRGIPGKVGVAHPAQVEIERSTGEAAQAAARRKNRGREQPGEAPGARQPEPCPWVDNAILRAEHAASVGFQRPGRQPEN
jgi:hypothetical protein